jgi:hypothetical protein
VVLEYVRETYGVPAYVGGRVRYTPPSDEVLMGTITGERAGHVRVRFDGRRQAVNMHPTWCLEYLDSPSPQEAPRE